MSERIVDQQTRPAENQALFRLVNERVGELNRNLDGVVPRSDWICECANTECFEHVEMSLAEYEALRENPTRFAVYPGDGHVVPKAERVVERTDRYWVVEKFGQAAHAAAELDPRNE